MGSGSAPATTMGSTQGAKQQGGFNYIQYRTELAQSKSTNPNDRIHMNPYHHSGESKPTLFQAQGNGDTTPNVQLCEVEGGATTTPARGAQWNKQELMTPLNRMSQGQAGNWAHSANTVKVKVPLAKSVPIKQRESWKQCFQSLRTILEETPRKILEKWGQANQQKL